MRTPCEDMSLLSPAWHADALSETEATLTAGEAYFIDWNWNLTKKRLLDDDAPSQETRGCHV